MNPNQQPPTQPRVLQLSDEEMARIKQAKAKHEKTKVTPEWQFIAEFGYFFGWEGVAAIMANQIDFDQAQQLIQGARKVWYTKVIDQAVATQAAVASAQSKKPAQVMKKGLKPFMDEVR